MIDSNHSLFNWMQKVRRGIKAPVLKGFPYPELSKNRFFFFFVSIDGTIIREYCRKIVQSISE